MLPELNFRGGSKSINVLLQDLLVHNKDSG